MTVKDLADKLDVRVKDVLGKLLMKGMRVTINSTLDADTTTMTAREFGADVEMRSFEEEIVSTEGDAPGARVAPVMGPAHQGKPPRLEATRETKVGERKAGGITQHIGAYHVE